MLDTAKARVLEYLGKGDGAFAAPRTVFVGNSPMFMVSGDVNGDQKTDLIFNANVPGSTLYAPYGFTFLLGNGNGGFRAPVTVMSSYGIGQGVLTVGDTNNDGHLDVITCDNNGNARISWAMATALHRTASVL